VSAPTTASILIVNYNYGRFIADAIDSALGQTWPNVQVVVVDDGSTDESALMMQTYGDAIQTVYKENGGQASGVNAGYPLLTGETVLFLDSDDMLEPDAIEKTIGFFADPQVVKVAWPLTIIDRSGQPTGEIHYRRLPSGDFRRQALRIGPASHFTPPHSGNFWRKSFLDQVMPVDEVDFRSVVDAYLFTFSPFFGSFHAMDEPLTRYRIHGKNISDGFTARRRREDWETRANHLEPWLIARGEDVSIGQWRKNNRYYRRLDGIVKGENRIGKHLPKHAAVALVAGPLYDRVDIRPLRPAYRAPDTLLDPERTEADFRAYLAETQVSGIDYIALQGSATWSNTNLEALAELLRTEHEVLYENTWIVIAKLATGAQPDGSVPESAGAIDSR